MTNLQKECKEGSVVLDVLSTRDFQVGEEIVIGKGTTSEEYNHIVAFGSIELRTPLQNSHASGSSVQIKATCAVFAKYYACATYHPYLEQIDCQHNLKPSDYGMNALSCAPEDAVHCCASTIKKTTQRPTKKPAPPKPATTKKPPTTTTKVATTKKVEIAPGEEVSTVAVAKGARTMVAADDGVHHIPVGAKVDIGLGTAVHEVNTIVAEKVAGRRLSTNSITFGSPLQFAHPAGTHVTVQAAPVANPCAPVSARLFNAKEVVQGQASASTFGSAGMLALWLFIGVAGLTAGARAMKRSAQRTIHTESMTSFSAVATDEVEEQQEEEAEEWDVEEYGLYEAPLHPKETIRMSSFMALPTEEEV